MEQKLKTVMADVFEISPDKIDGSTTMDSIEEWDSLRHIELLTMVEEKFGIELEMEEMIEMITFEDIKRILTSKGIKF